MHETNIFESILFTVTLVNCHNFNNFVENFQSISIRKFLSIFQVESKWMEMWFWSKDQVLLVLYPDNHNHIYYQISLNISIETKLKSALELKISFWKLQSWWLICLKFEGGLCNEMIFHKFVYFDLSTYTIIVTHTKTCVCQQFLLENLNGTWEDIDSNEKFRFSVSNAYYSVNEYRTVTFPRK